MQGLLVALDVNGTIVDGDSLGTGKEELEASTSLTEPAREFITNLTNRISVSKQSIQVVVYTFGVDWPGVIEEIEAISGGVICFDRQEGALYVGRAVESDPPAVFVRRLVEDKPEDQPFEYDGVLYNGPNPLWQDPGPALTYDAFRERTEGQHLVLRAVYKSGNAAVLGRQDTQLATKFVVSALPVLAFDDHPLDWELLSPYSRVIKAVSPANANNAEPATDFCKELANFEVSLAPPMN